MHSELWIADACLASSMCTGYARHSSPPTCFVLEELLLDCREDSSGTLADMASEVIQLMPAVCLKK